MTTLLKLNSFFSEWYIQNINFLLEWSCQRYAISKSEQWYIGTSENPKWRWRRQGKCFIGKSYKEASKRKQQCQNINIDNKKNNRNNEDNTEGTIDLDIISDGRGFSLSCCSAYNFPWSFSWNPETCFLVMLLFENFIS